TANEYSEKGGRVIAIRPNDIEYAPDCRTDKTRLIAKVLRFPFPYLFDETEQTAEDYDAACTPDFYIFATKVELPYRGPYDDSRPGKDVSISGKDLKSALDAVIKGEEVSEKQIPSGGCNIKWLP